MPDPVRIWYGDDEADSRTCVEISLGLDPAREVRVADSGMEALDMLGAGDWKPDIALLDVMMPGMTGMALLDEMRQKAESLWLSLAELIFAPPSAAARTRKGRSNAGKPVAAKYRNPKGEERSRRRRPPG